MGPRPCSLGNLVNLTLLLSEKHQQCTVPSTSLLWSPFLHSFLPCVERHVCRSCIEAPGRRLLPAPLHTEGCCALRCWKETFSAILIASWLCKLSAHLTKREAEALEEECLVLGLDSSGQENGGLSWGRWDTVQSMQWSQEQGEAPRLRGVADQGRCEQPLRADPCGHRCPHSLASVSMGSLWLNPQLFWRWPMAYWSCCPGS